MLDCPHAWLHQGIHKWRNLEMGWLPLVFCIHWQRLDSFSLTLYFHQNWLIKKWCHAQCWPRFEMHHSTWSALVQVMHVCLTTPNNYLNQYHHQQGPVVFIWLINITRNAKISISKLYLQIAHFKWQHYPLGASELSLGWSSLFPTAS